MTSTETRNLRDSVQNSTHIGGNYGSLAKSKIQRASYIVHNVERDDTLQRLALNYGTNVQEIKRINKVWSDAELSLSEHIYIPVNTSQLNTLRTQYPTLKIVEELPKTIDHHQKSSINTNTPNETNLSRHSSTSSSSTASSTTASSYQDFLSKIDQQIQSTKKTLQSMDIKDRHTKYARCDIGTETPKQ